MERKILKLFLYFKNLFYWDLIPHRIYATLRSQWNNQSIPIQVFKLCWVHVCAINTIAVTKNLRFSLMVTCHRTIPALSLVWDSVRELLTAAGWVLVIYSQWYLHCVIFQMWLNNQASTSVHVTSISSGQDTHFFSPPLGSKYWKYLASILLNVTEKVLPFFT